MKKIKIVLAAVICSAFALTSCSNDDDSSAITGNIVGKWNPIQTVTAIGTTNGPATPYENNQASCGKDYIEFTATNTLRNVVWNKNADNVCSEAPGTPGTWSKTNDTVTVTGGEYEGTYKITRLTGSELRVVQTGTVGGVTVTTTIYLAKAAN